MKSLFVLVMAALLFNGCLSGYARPSPTPAIPTATPVPTVTLPATPTPTVSTPEPSPSTAPTTVYVTVTVTATPPAPSPVQVKKGGIEILGTRTESVVQELGEAANADYHANPFVEGAASGGYFAELRAGTTEWRGVTFKIPEDRAKTGKWTVLTSTDYDFYAKSFFVKRDYYSKVFVVLGASYGERENRTLANLILHYADASSQTILLVSGKNVWNYYGEVPQESLFWKNSSGGEKLSAMEINATNPLVQLVSVEVRKAETGNDGVTVFAATAQKVLEGKRLTLTPNELDGRQYSRDYTGVDSKGVHLTFREQGNGTVYLKSGTFTTPLYDAETPLANFTKIAWDEEKPAGTQVRLEARVGPQAEIDRDWTEWFDAENNRPLKNSNRFVQFRFSLSTDDENLTPVVEELRVDYENPA